MRYTANGELAHPQKSSAMKLNVKFTKQIIFGNNGINAYFVFPYISFFFNCTI